MRNVCLLLVLLTISAAEDDANHHRCERITVEACQDMPYNYTRMPNFMGHHTQSEAALKFVEFAPLVGVGCSKHLKFFLCSLFTPMCAEQVETLIPSCQSICEEVKLRCLPVLETFNFIWPAILNCSKLPVPEKNALCMEFPNITEIRKQYKNGGEKQLDLNHLHPKGSHKVIYPVRTYMDVNRKPSCPPKYTLLMDKSFHNYKCLQKCQKDIKYSDFHKWIASLTMGAFGSFAFMSTLLSAITFLIDTERFKYPEKPIVFMNICHFFCSTAIMLRVFGGPEAISCQTGEEGTEYLAREGLENSGCIAVFLLLYYFGIASLIWWVNLTITWFLSAGKQWSHEAIQAKSSFFHFGAWGISAALTIGALILRYVDGDELTGLCFIGNHDSRAMLVFLIGPIFLFVITGIFFKLVGFLKLIRVKRIMQYDCANVQRFENHVCRIGVFNCLYAILFVFWGICYVYEYINMDRWEEVAMETAAQCKSEKNCILADSIADYKFQITKIILFLCLGITSAAWAWGSKTWLSWSMFCKSLCRRRKSNQKKFISYHQPANPYPYPHCKLTKGNYKLPNVETRV